MAQVRLMPMNTNKTLEQLEKDVWAEPEYNSKLVITCHQLRKKPLANFEVEDLRIMINQNIGLNFMIPLALDQLSINILAEGDYYEGDLLTTVLRVNREYWKENKGQLNTLRTLFHSNSELLNNFDTTEDIKQDWTTTFEQLNELK